MPYLIRRPPIRRSVCALIGAAIVAGASPAIASACKPASGGSDVFQAFGDSAAYTLAPGGSFESGASGWSLSDASVVAGNESYHVRGASDSHSLAISPTGVAVSPPICVDVTTPTFRFFARQTSGNWAQMNVNRLWTDASGVAHTTTAGSIHGTTNWAPTAVLNLGDSLPLWQQRSTLTVRLQFLPATYGGSWAIDDVYIDPYSR